MYESQFGLSGPPFQLSPDPQFYFDSRGHSHALAYLKYGVYQGEGFIVVTGEIGAGKTTLVRTLLSGLDSAKVVAAQVVSTQLESSDLLHAIIAAFGIKPLGGTKAQALATLEAFLTLLASQQRRALLIVDEAQNLNREAIEELRMLSNFQIGHHALLQSFLVGQPELRRILESSSMEQLRQRVIASCHLGPLDAGETRSYIEHRLHRVGWSGTPGFDAGAFDVIHRATGGIPRRINLLCNRLFLSAFLSGEHLITGQTIEATSRELRGEVGEGSNGHTLVTGSRSASGAPSQPAPLMDALDPRPGSAATPAILRKRGTLDTCVLALVENKLGYLKTCILQSEITRLQLASGVALVNPYEESDVAPNFELASQVDLPTQEYHLRVRRSPFDFAASDSVASMARLYSQLRPAVICVFGASDAVLMGALLARKLHIPVVHFDAGQRTGTPEAPDALNAMLLDRLSDSLFTTALTAHYSLYREGISSAGVVCGGSLVADVVQRLAPVLPPAQQVLDRALGPGRVSVSSGLVLVNSAPESMVSDVNEMREVVGLLTAQAQQTPLVWLADAPTTAALEQYRMLPYLEQSGVRLLPVLDDLQRLALLRGAHCLISVGSPDLMEEATSLGMARVVVGRGNAGADHWGSVFAGLNAKRLAGLVADAFRVRLEAGSEEPTIELAAPAAVAHLRTILRRAASERRLVSAPDGAGG